MDDGVLRKFSVMTALDQLVAEFDSLYGPQIERDEFRSALISLAIRDCKPGFIIQQGEEYSFTVEGILAFILVNGRKNPEATPKTRRLAGLIEAAIEELGCSLVAGQTR